MHPAPDAIAAWHPEQPRKLSAIEDVGERLALFGRAQHVRGITLEILALHAEAEEAAQRRDRARLARGRGPVRGLIGEKGTGPGSLSAPV